MRLTFLFVLLVSVLLLAQTKPTKQRSKDRSPHDVKPKVPQRVADQQRKLEEARKLKTHARKQSIKQQAATKQTAIPPKGPSRKLSVEERKLEAERMAQKAREDARKLPAAKKRMLQSQPVAREGNATHPRRSIPQMKAEEVLVRHCSDNEKNGRETDIDCGGDCADELYLWNHHLYERKCTIGQRCNVANDCYSGVCIQKSNRCGPHTPFTPLDRKTASRNMNTAYHKVSDRKNKKILGHDDLLDVFLLALNPDKQEIPKEAKQVIETKVANFLETHGLVAGVPIHKGYACRGASLELMLELNGELSSSGKAARSEL